MGKSPRSRNRISTLTTSFPKVLQARPTIISSSFPTLIPFRFTTCKYFNPLRTSCCTLKLAFMRNFAPSLIMNGLVFKVSSEPGTFRSMTVSERPSTSRASDWMMHRRLSEGSTARRGELLMPRDAFQRFNDSSFWSVKGE